MMRYLGGKSKIARHIGTHVNEGRAGRVVWEPFCGGLGASPAIGGPMICSDIHPGLIALYSAVQADPESLPVDWIVTREEWEWAKAHGDPADPVTAFLGFGLSFGGMWFGSFAEPRPSDPPDRRANGYGPQSARSVRKCVAALPAASFVCGSFFDVSPHDFGGIIYADPPYHGTAGYGVTFDPDAFVARVAEWAQHVPVFVSEYSFPTGRVVWEQSNMAVKPGLRGAERTAVERLYRVGDVS